VLRGHAGELELSDRTILPPVTLVYISCSASFEKCAESEWSVPRYCWITLGKPRDGCRIKMIVMVVGQNDHVDWRKAIEIDCRLNPASRTNELDWRCALAPDRIGQNVQARYLNQESCMTHPREGELIGCRTRHQERRVGKLELAWIGVRTPRISSSLDQGPLQEIRKSMQFGGGPRISESTIWSMMVGSWYL